MPEEARIVRNMEGFVPNQGIHNVNSPRVRPVIYPVTVTTDTGVGFGNPNMGWYAHHPMPISPGGIGENPNVIYQVGGGIGENHNLVNRVGGGGGVGQYPNYVNRGGCGIVENTNYVNQVGGGTSQNPSPTGRLGGGHGGSATFDQGSEDGVDDQYPGEKIKFLCSFGGKILRRPSDGLLRYAGGHTRIISVTRDISFQDLVHKMNDVCGKPVVIKYQLPDGELDSLVSVSCPEDLENMMEEYEKLAESPSTGSAKLRVFLFSISEFDPSGLGQFSDLLDSGQRYVDAVNGFPDGVSGGLTRKVSIGSVGSAQNSDGPVGGNESVDSSTYTQGDGGGVSSPSMSSPRVAADSPTSVVYVAPNPVVYAPSMAVGSPTVLTSLPQTFSSLPVERPLPAIGQAYSPLGYDLQKPSGMDYRPATAYMQAYLDPHQHLSSQVGYMNPQGVGIQGSIYRYADPPPQLSQQQFMPAVPMSMNSLDPHPGMNTNAVQHVMQPSQTRVDPYLGENAYKARVVQFPFEQNCHVYQPQSPPQQPTVPLQVGGACGRMPPPTQHVVLSDGRSAHTQGIAPEKLLQLEDCFMCQKALPHAHSDTVVQGQRTCISSTVSDVQLGSQPLNRVVVSGALGEVVCQGLRNQPQPMAQLDHTTSDLGRSGFSQDLELQSDKDRILHKPNNPDNPGGLFSQGVIGRAIDVKSPYGVILHDISPSHHEDGSPQSSVPHLCQVKQEPTGNVSVGSDFSPVDATTSQNLKPVVPESSTEYSGKKSGHFVNEDIPTFWISYDPIRPVEGRVEKTHVTPPQVVRNNELSSSPFYNHQREDVPVIRSQISGQEMFPSNVKPGNGINPDRNQIMPSGIMPSLSSEVAHFNGNRPVEPNQITNPGMLAISNLCTQPSMGTEHVISEELLHGKPGPDSDYATYKNLSVGDTEAEASGFQSRIASDTMVSSSRPASGDTSSSYGGLRGENWEHSPSNSFYSNRDPWTSQHYSQFISPKANMDGSNEESFIAKGESHKLSGHLNNYSNSENFRSSKDKAKEYVKQELKSGAAEVPRKTSGHLNMDSSQANKDVADEYIRQELKAVAEGVAAMALQPPLPSDSYAHGRSSISHELIGRVPDSDGESHMDVKTKLAEKQNTGLPLSEGIGRLQIIKNSDLEVLRELGSGTFGTVYHGKWRGSDVAIKRINNRCFSGKPSEQSRMIDDFWNEAINLADLHHPNVVAFYGVVLDGPGDSVATVTEFMVNGSLRHALQRTSDKRKRLLIAMDVAFGMEYLHGKNIVHFDLKSDNLLVNLRDPHRPICKVGDLGLSKVKCNTLISGGVRGTLPWMAPELLNGSSSLVSEKVDVFSFGIVMWELLTGEEPYGDLHYGIIIGGIVSNTLRPSVPESCDPEWKSLMERCWSSDPSERPSFKEISDILRSMSSSVSPKGQT